jgi:hypothetical protein
MKYKFLSRLVVLSVLLALIFSATGAASAQAAGAPAMTAPWSTNLLTNPGAETGNLSGWTTILNGGSGWAVTGTGYQGAYSFVTSYAWDTRSQEIDLLAAGFTAEELDHAPQVTIGEWVKGYECNGGCNPADKYYIRVELRNASHASIAAWNVGSSASPMIATSTWAEQTHTFAGYSSGLRYIYLEDGGRDAEGWGGNYGAMLDDAYVTMAPPPATPFVVGFTAASVFSSLDVPITAFTANDDVAVTGYMITSSSDAPSASAAGWMETAPTLYHVDAYGSYTLYPWARDADGHVSDVYGSPALVHVGPQCNVTEGFDNISNLPEWVIQNNSSPLGTTSWFQGDASRFSSQSGATNSYIAANYQNGAVGTATLSDWLITSPLILQNGAQLTFWTRTVVSTPYPDRLQVRMSTNGDSTNVGSAATDLGDFTTLLLDINPTYTTSGYPTAWTQYTVTLSGLSAPTTGRLAFRYFVENGGPSGSRSDYIGIDTMQFICGTPEVNISGNGTGIADDNATPSAADDTDFGSAGTASDVVDHVFTIQNLGTADLTLTGSLDKVVISGANAADFTVITQPASPVVAGASTTFTIRFDPAAMGLRSATISIANDDSDENPYSFDIQGTGLASTTTGVSSPTTPSAYGASVTFTATVSPTPDGGTVAFKDNGTTIPGCDAKSLSGGQATCDTSTLAVGEHSITAEYSGDASYAASASSAYTQTVVPSVVYAIPGGATSGVCDSWANACELRYALSSSTSGQEIWVKAGTYKPADGTDRAATFQLKDGVALYGGFAGTETARDQRGLAANVTILSGDIDNNDINTDGNNINETYADISGNNSYHVVRGAAGATLDGFIVTGGNANGSYPNIYGGGMFNWPNSNPTITNVTFSGNSAQSGGGMANNWYSSPTLTNVTFSGNSAEYAGGMYNDYSSPTLTNVTFSGNTVTTAGGIGGMVSAGPDSSPTLKNVIMANSIGGGDCAGTLNAASANNLIESTGTNACSLTNGTNGNIIGSDPLLGTLGNYGGFTTTLPLLPGSPAIDAGNATACTTGSDQRGVSYVGTCDIGAFESQGFTLAITGGNNQSVLPNAPFPIPLTVSVTANAALEPINGGKVTFTPPASGASVVLTGSPATITNGSASVDATANGTTGSYNVTASTRGADNVSFSLANKLYPVITWANPANIVYGTPLSGTQLNATANTPGAFTYTPASGTVLNAGTHTLHVEFTPTDTVNFTNASKDVSITVTKAAPVITWANPADIVYGTPLSATQLNATANTPGVFTYTPASGTVLNVGTHTLHVDFVPTDTVNYANASKDVSITVTKAAPVITWSNPANITYGTPLSATQLNATANTPGVFTYTPASGTVLNVGTHTLHVDFVPTDTVNYANASKDVSITITQTATVLTWADPADIEYGTALSATQLNATANVPGAFTYTPAAGAYLAVGTHTLHVDFVPTDTTNYANASKEVSITVIDHVLFADVPDGYWARPFIERLYLNQITGGCANNPLRYCPSTNVNRAMMAVFVLRAAHGPDFTPPTATGTVFADVPADGFAAAWIEQLAAEGITGGCGGGNYCPTKPVTRAQMAVFLVKAMYGTAYVPPTASGEIFADIPADGFAAAFIEQLVADGITGGCGGGNFCPNKYITRAEMAVFLVAAFNLP